ncbi:unnamed protein product [Spirodela intermedia]|uniref:Uncharacterized protein n=1 Tax=Spirodela intermedia TaxID=51605 RepID=A0A7I8IHT4_SPIIN|nr:unnamed protein product [Spirodela intermedia]CAA6657431.1 unnamed protein product [Spirodela intermedia]
MRIILRKKDFSLEPKLELKPLPSSIKYDFLGKNQLYYGIISSSLSCDQEERLLSVLKTHKTAIGWSLDDIQEVIREESLKLLKARIIYYISNGPWRHLINGPDSLSSRINI